MIKTRNQLQQMKIFVVFILATMILSTLMACTITQEDDDGVNHSKKVLRVAMECANIPYNWKQETDENGAIPIHGKTSEFAYGYDVMMAKHIAEKLDYELEIVMLDWNSIIPAVQTAVVEIAICGHSMTEERKEKVDFTIPYYYATIAALVKEDSEYADAKSLAKLKGATVTSQLRTVWNDVCVSQIPEVNALPGQKSAAAMMIALTLGRVDAVVTDKPSALSAVAADASLKMLTLQDEDDFKVSDDDINIGISVKKGNDALREAINAVLADMTAEDFNHMMDEAIALQPLSKS